MFKEVQGVDDFHERAHAEEKFRDCSRGYHTPLHLVIESLVVGDPLEDALLLA